MKAKDNQKTMATLKEVYDLMGPFYLSFDSYCELTDIYKGYYYLVRFGNRGHRCGYVAIPKDDLLKYDLVGDYESLSCHGGITFDNINPYFQEATERWIGFDCHHAWDEIDMKNFELIFPENAENHIRFCEKYDVPICNSYSGAEIRDTHYVEKECKEIIEQLVKINNKGKQ